MKCISLPALNKTNFPSPLKIIRCICVQAKPVHHPPDKIPIAVGVVVATIVLASIAFVFICCQQHRRKTQARLLRVQYQQIEAEHRCLLEENERLRSRFSNIYSQHIQLIESIAHIQKPKTSRFINEKVDQLIFDRNCRIITVFR